MAALGMTSFIPTYYDLTGDIADNIKSSRASTQNKDGKAETKKGKGKYQTFKRDWQYL